MQSARNIRLAIVDDDPLFLEQVANILSRDQGMEVVRAANGSELFDALNAGTIDCVVLDYDLGTETGLSVGAEVRSRLANPPPIVMLTGEGSERTAVKAFRSGFSDYVTKRNLQIRELAGAIRAAVERQREADEIDARTNRLKNQLQIESVTGLHSVAHVRSQIKALARAQVAHGFAVIVLWLRDLARIRSSLGNVVASRVLQEFARRLKHSAGSGCICSYGEADGFVCLVSGKDETARVAEICTRLSAELDFSVEIDRTLIRVAPQVGSATFPADGEDAGTLIEAARGQMEMAVLDDARSHATAPDTQAESGSGEVIESLGERRESRRQRVLKRGKIRIEGTSAIIDCTVRDLSPLGARLRVDGYFAAPERFELMVVGAGAAYQPVEVSWQAGTDIGVNFRGPVT